MKSFASTLARINRHSRISTISSIRSFHSSRASLLDINIEDDFKKFETLAEQGKSAEVISIINKDQLDGKITYKNAWRYIRGYALLKKEAEAEQLYNQFIDVINPDDKISLIYHYNAILNVYINTQNTDKASKIFRQIPKIPKKAFEELLAQQKK
ncbi:predicted protein [Naegleria gruberi]|uniref:Predicted protein n=1 Tax=Naegleria gruberi TaxID=5762 RepID=D2VXQ8_NAEGR|nr:uncharacterized protein NAEGRDRAFT_73835 [Naegleria gruberi]EFC38334.1 predicted protein [Naegleria gruberi]|eukprot:XP_002671078.1 predicted protein [Naegleria gruberi strain NEG-M]